jgi:hypothetical protein
MKSVISTLCLMVCALTLAGSAKAQENLNFANLPLVNTPSPMPDGYGQLNWGNNLYYVNPYGWSGAGPGYKLGPQGEDVVFIGAKNCRLMVYACYGTLTDGQGFQLVSAKIAAGFGPTMVTFTAYNNSNVVGSANYVLTTQIENLNFPQSWGVVTQVVIQVSGQPDDLVFYNLSLYTLGG